MNLILLGAPGAGKGTQASRLAKEKKLAKISTGDILRQAVLDRTELGKKAKGFMDTGELVPDDVILDMVEERLKEEDCSNGFILDGFPRTVPQAEGLEKLLEKSGSKIEFVVFVDVTDEEVIKRLSSRRVCRNCNKLYNLITDSPVDVGRCDECGSGELYQRNDDREETIINRLKIFKKDTAPLVDWYRARNHFDSVNGNLSPEETFSQILRIVDGDG